VLREPIRRSLVERLLVRSPNSCIFVFNGSNQIIAIINVIHDK
jgi:hypothetical protein